MVENFLNLMETINLHTQEAQLQVEKLDNVHRELNFQITKTKQENHEISKRKLTHQGRGILNNIDS